MREANIFTPTMDFLSHDGGTGNLPTGGGGNNFSTDRTGATACDKFNIFN